MSQTTVHIINHTHWDREWFLSSVYTTHWIPTLIDKLLEISAENPNFRYLLDGQTLIIEDLLQAYPEYRPKVEKLISDGNLTIGPYYCQPDWKLTSGELLIRNLEYGRKDSAEFGSEINVGWLVDTFGHISQAPQIHKAFGIEAVYVWRGVPELTPYFNWQGADGQEILGINLFGGYRNLYGVTHAPEVALTRLSSEVEKLSPYYPTPDIPLFDGYDLEDNPEDSVTFLSKLLADTEHQLELLEATPDSFVEDIRPKLIDLPIISGELNSGKYGATFPGIYSSRDYLKVMNHDCAALLHRVAQPLASLAWLRGGDYDAAQFESWDRLLLQNGVHDCICGVSIDLVHEKMEDIYRSIFEGARTTIEQSLSTLLHDFSPGFYAISTNPFAYQQHQATYENHHFQGSINGIGVRPMHQTDPREATRPTYQFDGFDNGHYKVELGQHNRLYVNGCWIGLQVFREAGDTYSDETKEPLPTLGSRMPPQFSSDGNNSYLKFTEKYWHQGKTIDANVTVTLNSSRLMHWEIELDTTGVDFCVKLEYRSGIAGEIYAGMPFDVVARDSADTDLLPRKVEGPLTNILLGQRELNTVTTFPFQEYLVVSDGERSAAIFAKGINAYEADENGTISLTLRRSIEWLTKTNLENRIGDAGPFLYVPSARCERSVKHEVAFAFGDFEPQGMQLQQLNAIFQNPPLIVEVQGDGTRTQWKWQQPNMPMSSLRVCDDNIEIRLFNPTLNTVDGVAPKQIESRQITADKSPSQDKAIVRILNMPTWRVGANHGSPEQASIARLEELAEESREAMISAEINLKSATGNDRHLWQHKIYVHHREMLEYQLSVRLNELRLQQQDELTDAYLYEPDPVVTELGYKLNQLRIKRRIYDYVVATL